MFPRSIAALRTVVYSAGAGVVPKGNRRQKNSSSSTISIQVHAVVAFACIRRYALSRYIFPIRICFIGHLLHIYEIMCSILIRQNP